VNAQVLRKTGCVVVVLTVCMIRWMVSGMLEGMQIRTRVKDERASDDDEEDRALTGMSRGKNRWLIGRSSGSGDSDGRWGLPSWYVHTDEDRWGFGCCCTY
jgi:hypothetical protein